MKINRVKFLLARWQECLYMDRKEVVVFLTAIETSELYEIKIIALHVVMPNIFVQSYNFSIFLINY